MQKASEMGGEVENLSYSAISDTEMGRSGNEMGEAEMKRREEGGERRGEEGIRQNREKRRLMKVVREI